MTDFLKFYNKLNDRQKRAVDTIDGPLIVLAGPGTGKTQLLSVRSASILKKGDVKPTNILILTYTNSAAKAMKERLASIIGPAGYDVEVGTFHSFANTIIQDSEEAAIYTGDKVQMTDVERMRVIEYILDNTKGLEEIRPFRAPYTYLKEILQKIGDLKKDGVSPRAFADYLKKSKSLFRGFEEKYRKRLSGLAIVYDRYEKLKEGKDKNIFDERGRYDFEDMIIFATDVLKNEPGLRDEYQAQYRYVMVDEFQDTNGAQLELLFQLLKDKKPNLMCVGDDDQSIYRFQGASVANFKLLSDKYPETRTIHLRDNYRSTDELIEASSRIIGMIPSENRIAEKSLVAVSRHGSKEISFRIFTTEDEELEYIIDRIGELKTIIENDASLTPEEREEPYNNIAILVRKRSAILKIVDAFLRTGIPYATDGKEDISGEMRVKQLLDVLDLAHTDPSSPQSKDLTLYRILSSDYLDIPQKDILRLLSYINRKKAAERSDASILSEFLGYFSSKRDDIRLDDPQKLLRAASVITNLLRDAGTRSIHTILMDYIRDTGLFKFILREYQDNNVLRIRQVRSLSAFVNMVKQADMANPAMRLADFMLDMKTRRDHGLGIQGDLVTLTQTGVRVFTAHGSKGQEFHSVIIPFCLHNKNWPARPIPDKIPLPPDLLRTRVEIKDKDAARQLNLHDETRLFYVASTRAKSHLIFTASPTTSSITSPYLDRLDIVKKESSGSYADEETVIRKSFEMTDKEDPFIGTGEILNDMVANMSFNPTRLNTYLTCKRKFLYNDLLRLPGPKKKSLVFGNCAHKALEETFREFMKTGRFPDFDFFNRSFRKELKYQGADKVMESDCLKKAETMKEWFAKLSANPVVPIGLERKLLITIGDNVIFTGKYDKVEWEDESRGLVRIVDYKTGKPDDHVKSISTHVDIADPECDGYLRQLVCYRLLYEKDRKESGAKRASHGVLVFCEGLSSDIRKLGYKKGQYVNLSVPISDDMVAKMEELIKESWRRIKKLEFDKLPERDEAKCGKCDFQSFCWE